MKTITKIALPALLFVSGFAYSQTTTSPSTPNQTTSPSTPSTGKTMEDTTMKGKKEGMNMDTTGKSSSSKMDSTTTTPNSSTPNSSGTSNGTASPNSTGTTPPKR